MADELKEIKLDAERFLSEQIQQLDPEQKKRLSYVLYGANMANSLLKPQQEKG